MVLQELLVAAAPLYHSDNEVFLHRFSSLHCRDEEGHLVDRSPALVSTEILATCRQLHAEGAYILFTGNTFMLDDKAPLDGGKQVSGMSAPRIALPIMPRCYLRLFKHVQVSVSSLSEWRRTLNQVCRCPIKLPHIQTLVVVAEDITGYQLSVSYQGIATRENAVHDMARMIREGFEDEWTKVPRSLWVSFEGPKKYKDSTEAYSRILCESVELAKTLRNSR